MKQDSTRTSPALLLARSSSARRRRERGWTLIEVVVVLIILAIVVAVGGRMMSNTLRSYFAAKDITNSDAQARVAFERMTRELRQIRSTADIDIASAIQFRFIDADGNGICYFRDVATNRLMRSTDGPAAAGCTSSPQPLSDFVSSLNFYYYTTAIGTPAGPASVSYITVKVGVTDNDVSDTLRATIHPRSFP